MRPRPGVERAALEAAVAAQAAWYRERGALDPEEFGHLPVPVAPRGAPDLGGLVEACGQDAYRVQVLVLNQAFPPEWRSADHRSHLPDELAARVRRWRRHLEEVAAGGHREFLRAWHDHRAARETARAWGRLRELAEASGERANAWARRPELVELRERILAAEAPVVPDAPRWGAVPPDEPGELDEPGQDRSRFVAMVREWNRRVPGGQKVRLLLPAPLERELAEAVGCDWLAQFLDWAQRAADEGRGLLLC
ncbi:hypothetical protein ACSNOI_36880 [Actinomadura kijaniata]|uniref:hypothetical protein n=1 Tax=Actinomadura kijaniata TaxID=46161 RepID=UPI003F1AEFC4